MSEKPIKKIVLERYESGGFVVITNPDEHVGKCYHAGDEFAAGNMITHMLLGKQKDIEERIPSQMSQGELTAHERIDRLEELIENIQFRIRHDSDVCSTRMKRHDKEIAKLWTDKVTKPR